MSHYLNAASRRAHLLLFSLISIQVLASIGVAQERPAKPNIVLILTDDLGWQDVKCYDIDEPSPMETPNIDALAQRGVMFWQAYSPAPVCAPSRAAILSGLHPAHGEMTSVAGGYPPHPPSPRATQISPFYMARMPVERFTLAEAMKAEGYRTGHSGKWHISNNHYEYPKPYRHGFDSSTHERGVQVSMKPDRLTGFATRNPKDPFRLDENGFPLDVPQQAALDFIHESKKEPFFLYYATWLVHAPIVMRSEQLLHKYEQKLGVTLTAEHKDIWKTPGQTNPFYCAMVEQLDYYMGQIFNYLETTDDPRWPGHTLIENTYIIFTSDNGGMEGGRGAVYTDNVPLDRGKISLKEGGTRVPLIITGPGIPAGVQTDVMVNGLDFYPTILSLIGVDKPADKHFDGCDLASLLTGDPTDATRVRDADGKVRDGMIWHFPQAENTSSIRVGDYKLFRSYRGDATTRSLYRLYNRKGDQTVRSDIEEMKDLASELPEKTAEMDAQLTEMIEEMGGRLPYLNPRADGTPKRENAPTIVDHRQNGNTVEVTYRNNGARVVHADLIYSPNDGREWLRASGRLDGKDKVIVTLPQGTSHYFINLVDENNFLVIHPLIDRPKMQREKLAFRDVALFAGYPEPTNSEPVSLGDLYAQRIEASPGRTVLRSEDFEKNSLSSLNTAGEGSSITKTTAATGKHSLRLFEEKGLAREWMPLVSTPISIPAQTTSGTFRVSLDVMLEKEAPGVIALGLKDSISHESAQSAAQVRIGNGAIKANDRFVSELQPGEWHHVELSGQLGLGGDKMLTVSITTVDGRAWNRKVPYTNFHFDRPTDAQIIGLGPVGSAAYVDNMAVTIED
ncbi:MAG: N-acetylgalactosamine-6-sulfatase [Psychrobacter sp.]|nr:N-acetylgalactosamine-6-sulfatase [Psychrobacter sp.]